MAVYRQVHVSFWQDPDILEYTPEEKYFYLYLMTNSKTSQCGIYELPKKIIVLETGYNQETIEKLLKRFVDYKKILYCDESKEIMVLKWIKYNSINSPKVQSCIKKELSNIKNKKYIDLFYRLCEQYQYSIDRVSKDYGEEEEKEEEEEREKEGEEEREDILFPPYEKIKNLFNDICKSYSKVLTVSKTRKSKIKARWNEIKSLDKFEELFRTVESNQFLKGNNKKGWKCSFDWLIENDNNYVKVLEGQYSSNSKAKDNNNIFLDILEGESA